MQNHWLKKSRQLGFFTGHFNLGFCLLLLNLMTLVNKNFGIHHWFHFWGMDSLRLILIWFSKKLLTKSQQNPSFRDKMLWWEIMMYDVRALKVCHNVKKWSLNGYIQMDLLDVEFDNEEIGEFSRIVNPIFPGPSLIHPHPLTLTSSLMVFGWYLAFWSIIVS